MFCEKLSFTILGLLAGGAYMMFKGATSRTDVSSTSSNPFGLSVCLLYSLQTISGALHVSSSAIKRKLKADALN